MGFVGHFNDVEITHYACHDNHGIENWIGKGNKLGWLKIYDSFFRI